MKNILKLLTIVAICLVSFNSSAQSVSLPVATLSEAPLGTVENNGTGMAGFDFVESSGADVPSQAFGEPNVSISVDLNYVELSNFNVDQITGTLLDYFTTSYDQATNILLFSQSNVIPGDWSGAVEFSIDVIQNSTQDESFNGFNANVAALDGATNAEGNASIYTYTDENVLSVTTIDPLIFNVLPNPTDGIFTIDLEQKGDAKVELFDLLGKEIFTKDYYNQDTITLNIEYLASAVYVLKVTSNGAAKSVKIMKE